MSVLIKEIEIPKKCIDKEDAVNALDRIFSFCEEIDNHLPDIEKTGYKMIFDYLIILNYLNNQQ